MRKMIATSLLGLSCLPATAGVMQVGDLRLSSVAVPTQTSYDPGFAGFTTRAVTTAPVQINSDVSGTSQYADGTLDSKDIALQTYTPNTQIRNLNYATPDADNDPANGGFQQAGGVQWSFDLSPLDAYLASNNLGLTALDLDLATTLTGGAGDYDFYLSYTSPTAGTTLTQLGNDGSSVFSAFTGPGIGQSEGTIVNDSFEILVDDASTSLLTSESLLSLYDEGVREFNLVLTSNKYMRGRSIVINEGSGLSITTAAVPEPASAALIGLGLIAVVGGRRR